MIYKVAFYFSFTYPCPRKLRQIMKMSMIQRETPSKVQDIWKQYHHPRINNTATVISKEKYNLICQRANSAPFFLIPVFRKGGHFKLFTQWQKDSFLGTYLQDYKRKGSNSSPYMVFTMFTQLLSQKNMVLVRGDVINNSLTKPEAQRVWQMLQQSYCNENTFPLIHNFNNNPKNFSEQAYNLNFGT